MKDRDYHEEMGLRLYAAYLSSAQGMGLQYTYDQYAKDVPPSDFWTAIAQRLDTLVRDAVNRQFPDVEQPPTDEIVN